MQEAVPVTRPLQNHLPVVRHLTTQAGLWMPQYLQGRAGVRRQSVGRGLGSNGEGWCLAGAGGANSTSAEARRRLHTQPPLTSPSNSAQHNMPICCTPSPL